MRHTLCSAVVTALAGAVLSLNAFSGTAHAHGGALDVEITGHDFGRVRTTVVWDDDNDPVDGRLAATVNAVSADGRTVGPWKLVRAGANAIGWTTAEALPPGRWKITVEAGYPALGRDQEELTVSPGTPASPSVFTPTPGTPTATMPKAALPTTAPESTAPDARPEADTGTKLWPWATAAVAALVAATGTAAVLRARRRRTARR
ncbi:hypothetical protein ACGFMM_23045 [Streptomyces sp. NPDC048604]|uniref:hypothetical protein n=1 Tax=Streptomyces sp. NPDC048604 TaxID=3365578 RepID=UPI00371093E4